jgi:hypothetical protein
LKDGQMRQMGRGFPPLPFEARPRARSGRFTGWDDGDKKELAGAGRAHLFAKTSLELVR